MAINITSDMKTSLLIQAFNFCAKRLGMAEVNKFADRGTAEKRVRNALSMLAEDKRPAPFGPVDIETPVDEGTPMPNTEKQNDAGAKADQTPAPVATDPNALNFGERAGTKRDALIKALVAKRGEYVPVADLVSAVYGKGSKVDDFRGPLNMVMKGLTGMIAKNNLPVELKKQKEGKDIAYGLIDAGK